MKKAAPVLPQASTAPTEANSEFENNLWDIAKNMSSDNENGRITTHQYSC